MLNQQREQVVPILLHSTAYIIEVVICWQYSQPDATYHAVKKAGQEICSKIIIFSIGCAVFGSALIGGSSALRFKTAQVEGVLDRNDRVMVKQTGWPNFVV
ncbi:MAG: hypothetical protein MZW92_00745 [Comamonadaceae bacterium]|nr:hypothetical protein [Comamonadaceae bacterium]